MQRENLQRCVSPRFFRSSGSAMAILSRSLLDLKELRGLPTADIGISKRSSNRLSISEMSGPFTASKTIHIRSGHHTAHQAQTIHSGHPTAQHEFCFMSG